MRVRPLLFMELFAPWQRPFGYGPWDVLSLLATYGYRFLFMCPDGLIENQPTRAAPYPPEYAQGYNLLAFTAAHAERIAASSIQTTCWPPALASILAKTKSGRKRFPPSSTA
jgi:hypothetical protein